MTDAKGTDSEMPSVPILRTRVILTILNLHFIQLAMRFPCIIFYISYKFHVIAHEQFHR